MLLVECFKCPNNDVLFRKGQWLQKNLDSRSKLTREQLSRKISRGRKRRRTWKAVGSQAVPRYLTFQSQQLRRKETPLLPLKERFRACCFWITQLYTHRPAHGAPKQWSQASGLPCFLPSVSRPLAQRQPRIKTRAEKLQSATDQRGDEVVWLRGSSASRASNLQRSCCRNRVCPSDPR